MSVHSPAGDKQRSISHLEVDIRGLNIQDHEGNDVCIVWSPRPGKNVPRDRPPPFPYQVYLTGNVSSIVEDPDFPATFATFIQRNGGIPDSNCNYRFEVYRKHFPNILAAVAHQRKEVSYRNRNGIVPRLVQTWTTQDEGYKGRIIVIDRDDWDGGGITLVKFDPAEYDKSSRFNGWNVAGVGDCDIVKAVRCKSEYLVRECLRSWWMDAGHTWTEADLTRRNDGGFSPALYPAVDPLAHHDAEHEEVHELDGTALPGPAGQMDTEAEDDGTPRIIDTFDKSELFKRPEELQQFYSETYSDSFGLPVTDVWDSRRSKLRPSFSMTLYLSFDLLPLLPKALFGCLNRGLIAREAWTLDVISNMPSLSAAFQYHARASVLRTTEKTAQRRRCMQTIVQRIAGSQLPRELLEFIEDLVVPPEIPRYSSRPIRPFEDVFLYLDGEHLSTGPLVIYSNPKDFWNINGCSSSKAGLKMHDIPIFADWKVHTLEEDILRVVYLRYWHRVADELHILWNLCSPRCHIASLDQLAPWIELRLTMPEACVWRATGQQYINGYPDVELVVHSERPITIHHKPFFSHDIWAECVDFIDLSTGKAFPPLPHKYRDFLPHCDSWSRSKDLGFTVDCTAPSERNFTLTTFQPGTSHKLDIVPQAYWWFNRVRDRLFQNGHEYSVRLKPGLTIPRWTYGPADALEGPYNLPPLEVSVDETPLRFKFRVESVGAPVGSFNR